MNNNKQMKVLYIIKFATLMIPSSSKGPTTYHAIPIQLQARFKEFDHKIEYNQTFLVFRWGSTFSADNIVRSMVLNSLATI